MEHVAYPRSLCIDDLLLRLDFRNPEPDVIDISPEGGTVATLQLSKLDCLSSDKVVYLTCCVWFAS